MSDTITLEDYKSKFKGKEEKALCYALDIRKFEIDMYWKRATYFWTFIAAALAGYVAIQISTSTNKQDLSIVIACLGLVFSFAWFSVNKGSKFWQENWENHVDMLENGVTGPLYKVVLSRDTSDSNKIKDFVIGPKKISVSKINQLISFYVSVLWLILLYYALPSFDFEKTINWFYVVLIGFSLLACWTFMSSFGKSHTCEYKHSALLRESTI